MFNVTGKSKDVARLSPLATPGSHGLHAVPSCSVPTALSVSPHPPFGASENACFPLKEGCRVNLPGLGRPVLKV